MSIQHQIILSQLNPPAQRNRVLARSRINNQLQQSINYPVTILEAGTGYGKSTSILSFINSQQQPIYWFSISGTDRDPKLFLAKLFTVFNQHQNPIGEDALQILELPEASSYEALIAFVNDLSTKIDQNAYFILDDFHRVCDVVEVISYMDWLIENLPTKMHMLIASRYAINFPSINKWRVKGQILEIDKDDLAFTSDEIALLFEQHYEMKLSKSAINQLLSKTEGWAIGLQMVWQSLQNNPTLTILQVLEDERHSKSTLFEYLADEVLSGLDHEIQNFLLNTSILSKLESASCDFLLMIENSDHILQHLINVGLFIEELRPGVFRYHQMFREFLISRLQQEPQHINQLHLKIASYYRAHEYWEESINHLLSAEDYHQVNQILENIGRNLVLDGRHESINYWVSEIPETIRQKYPYLIYLLGEVNRYLGNFEEALEYYHTAERLYRHQQNPLGISWALRGQGQVFLDTIRPNNGDQLLQDALKLLDPNEMPHEVADLLVLIAENQLNLGHPDRAEKLLRQAKELSPDLEMETDYIQARVYLRTGRLQEGIDLLLDREANNPTLPLSRPQRFHRESTLLLSLFHAIWGDDEHAEQYARQGIEIGKQLRSKFVQSVGFMRLGHALLLRDQHPFTQDSFDQAMRFFQQSIEQIDVVRIHVEPLWGMCRALGFNLRYKEAEQLAFESLEIAKKAGDEWISILIQLSLGASAVLTLNYEAAQEFLTTAETLSIKVKDPFTLSASRLWLAIKAWQQGYQNTAFAYFEKCIALVKAHQYEFLLTKETLLGLKDGELIYPLMLAAYNNHIETQFLGNLLRQRGIEKEKYHPGYSLWVQTLGGFKVWLGAHAVEVGDWKREKARHFFEILVAYRGKWTHKDQINEILWGDTSSENTTGYLKVIYNSVNQVLEPDRPRGVAAFFVERNQELYRLNPNAHIIVDADLMMEKIKNGAVNSLENALKLYRGCYFEDSYVREWLTIEEQYYHQHYLIAADQLLSNLIETEKLDEALTISYQILNQDPYWEGAYRAQMRIFYNMGRISMMHEVYQRCCDMIQNHVGGPISQETQLLYQQLS